MSLPIFIGIAVLGGVGAVLRFLVDGSLSSRLATSFPAGTIVVNLSGSLLLGVIVGAGFSGDGLHLLALGLLGGFTTFSTWVYETHRLAEAGLARMPALNIVGSLVLGLGAVWLGLEIGGLL
jgi:CrcB protein